MSAVNVFALNPCAPISKFPPAVKDVIPSTVPPFISKALPSISTEPAVNLPPNVKAPMFVEFTVVDTTLPKDAVDINELVTLPIASMLEPLPTILTVPKEPVEVIEPLIFGAFSTVEPLIKAFATGPKVPSNIPLRWVAFTLPKEPVEINEPDTSPTKSKDEPESFRVNLPKEAVDA